MSKIKVFAVLLLFFELQGLVFAQQSIKDASGSTFMEELPEKSKAGQQIRTEDGSLFMEEDLSGKTKPKKENPRPLPDFSSLGIPLNEKGRIIPLIQPDSGPVMRNFSRLELEYTPAAVYVPYYQFKPYYGYRPYYSPYSPYSSPFIGPQYAGAFAVPLSLPRYYASSSDDPQSQDINYQAGAIIKPPMSASIWSPSWKSPFRAGLFLPPQTEYTESGRIRSFFPKELNP